MALSNRTRGSGHVLKRVEILYKREELLYCEAYRGLEQAAQGGGGVSSGGAQNLPGHFSVQPPVGNLLQQGVGLDDFQRSPPTSTIL